MVQQQQIILLLLPLVLVADAEYGAVLIVRHAIPRGPISSNAGWRGRVLA